LTDSFTRGIGQQPAVDELLEKWKQAPNKQERDRIEQNLRAALQAEFQARLAAHENEIDQLEGQVKRLRQQLELRRQKQTDIVRFHLEQLLREVQGLGWGTEPVQNGRAGWSGVKDVPSAFPPPTPRVRWSVTRDGESVTTVNEITPVPTTAVEPAAPPAAADGSKPVETIPQLDPRPAVAPPVALPPGPAPETPKPDEPGAGTPNSFSDKAPAATPPKRS
jgi:hypothetical protein